MDKKQQVINYNYLKERLDSITPGEHRVFLKTVYAGLARIGEVVRGRYKENSPLGKTDFEQTHNLLIITIQTQKTGRTRRVPISRIEQPNQEYLKKDESWLTEDIYSYVTHFDNYVWNKSTRWGELVFKKYFPEYNNHIHLLRHWRASHLLQGSATGVPVPERVVAKMGGWVGTKTLTATYDGTTIEDYVDVI